MPSHADFEAFRRVIVQLPDIDSPFMFGLPDNIERSLQRVTSTVVIRQLRALSLLDAAAVKYDREKWRIQLGPILDLWQQLTSSNSGLLQSSSRGSKGGESSGNSIDDFVLLESELSCQMCVTVDHSIASLKKVLFGSGLLTPSIQAMAAQLLSGNVPPEWNKRWEGPEKPQTWLRELARKRIAVMKWKSLSAKSALLESPLALGDIFNPATFVNALRQQTARKLGLAIDRVKMIASWESEDKARSIISRTSGCPLPCVLTGMLLQGAIFQGRLKESPSDAAENSAAPDVCIGFVSSETAEPYSSDETIAIPAYLTPTREDFLMDLPMPSSNQDKQRWILAGVGLFLSDGE